jgi:hypothetical protein
MRREHMAKQQDTNTSKSRVIGICVAVVMAALVGVIVYLLVTRTTGIKEEPRNVVVTQNNVEKVLDNLEKMEESESVAPGYYTVTMNPTWHFKTGSEASYDAIVKNVEANTNDVFFDIVLEEDENKVLYKSPVIPRGGELKDIALEEQLSAGTYPCVVIYHLIDEDQNTLSTLRVTLSIIVEG